MLCTQLEYVIDILQEIGSRHSEHAPRNVTCSCLLTQARTLSNDKLYSDEAVVIADLPRELWRSWIRFSREVLDCTRVAGLLPAATLRAGPPSPVAGVSSVVAGLPLVPVMVPLCSYVRVERLQGVASACSLPNTEGTA